jgi:hypothetical protein
MLGKPPEFVEGVEASARFDALVQRWMYLLAVEIPQPEDGCGRRFQPNPTAHELKRTGLDGG